MPKTTQEYVALSRNTAEYIRIFGKHKNTLVVYWENLECLGIVVRIPKYSEHLGKPGMHRNTQGHFAMPRELRNT